jgi:tetratricopeptide (TPR) repeat protein
MNIRNLFWVVFLFALSVSAQEHQHGDHSKADVGEVNFPVSCQPETQVEFNHAVALLHDFWYAESEKAFNKIAESDPECAMAYWGVAMSNYHPVWTAPPTETEMTNGQTAVKKALALKTATEREAGYLTAISTFYKDADKLDRKTRANLYAQEMEKVHRQNPEDLESAIFYALALLGTADISDKTYSVQKQAAAILTPLVEKAPNHPGIAHYIIHSFDYPPLAELALPAARSYAKIAPESPHALHMPSHIFTRLGLWDESIQSNLASAEKAKLHVQSMMPGIKAGSFDELHAMDYLVYAYLQLGQEDKAKQIVEEAHHIEKLDRNAFQAAYSFAAMPARIAIEGHHWKDAAGLKLVPAWFPWEKFPSAEAIIRYAVGIGAARTGDLATANKAAGRLNEIHAMLDGKDAYWAKQVDIQQKSVSAWILFGEGKKPEALSMMKSIAEMEDSTEKDPVTPGAIMPAHELVAEMLLETNDAAQAQLEFDKSLAKAPNRRHPSMHKAALAAKKS